MLTFLRKVFKKQKESSSSAYSMEREYAAASYIAKKEKIKTTQLQEKINQDHLNNEYAECLNVLKATIQKNISENEWSEIKSKEFNALLTYSIDKLQNRKWIFDTNSNSVFFRCSQRLIHIQQLQEEMKGQADLEVYYKTIKGLDDARFFGASMYGALHDLSAESYKKIDAIIDAAESNLDENEISALIKKISCEVGGYISDKMECWLNQLKTGEFDAPKVDIDIGLSEIKKMLSDIDALKVQIRASHLRNYILLRKS